MQRVVPRTLATGALIALVVAFAWLWPKPLGGATSYVTTNGSSMAPEFHSGDLALVRPARTYRVGDIVAYHSALLNTVVLHRIVDISDGHYQFKGDNNSWRDAEQPTESQLIGRLWIHVPHAGILLTRWRLTIAFGIAALLVFGGTGIAHPRRRRSERTRMTAHPSPFSARHLRTATLALACCSGLLVAFAALAASQPAQAAASTKIPYSQRAAFSYNASAPASVYQDGIVTGEPVFLRVADTVDVAATYDFAPTTWAQVTGTIGLRAELSDGSGWHRTFVITPPAPFDGTHATTHGPLNIQALEGAAADLRAATGATSTTFTVRVLADVHVTAAIDGHPASASFSPALEFQLDPIRLTPTATDPDRSPFIQSTSDALDVTTTHAKRLAAFGLGVDVRSLPLPIMLAGALTTIAALACARGLRRRVPDTAGRIARKLGSRVVPVRAAEPRNGLCVLDVGTIEDLVRLADAYGHPILQEGTGDESTYSFHLAHVVYRYRV